MALEYINDYNILPNIENKKNQFTTTLALTTI
jgi:hypothetical protein